MRFIDKLKAFFFNEQQVGIINIGDLIDLLHVNLFVINIKLKIIIYLHYL